jgi:hypothetical protein
MAKIATDGRRATGDAAMARLSRLIAEAKTLEMMGGEPRARAKAAAELARQIKEAAKDFAASADPGVVGTSGVAAVTDTQSTLATAASAAASATAVATSPGSTTQDGANGQTAAADSGASPTPNSPAPTNSAAASPSTNGAPPAGNPAPATASTALGTPQDAVRAAAATGARLLAQLGPAGVAGVNRSKAEASERAFFGQVKAALAGLRGIIARAASEDRDGHWRKEVDAASKAVDAAIDTIGAHGEGETSGDGGTGGTGGEGDAGGAPSGTGSATAGVV